MKLYDSVTPNRSRKIRAVAHEVGIALEIVPLNLRAGEHRRPEFIARNPNGKIPVLEDGDFVLWESNAILTYLASLRPDKQLIPTDPTDPRGRADVDRWLHWDTSHWTPALSKPFYERVLKPRRGEQGDEAVARQGLDEIARLAPVLDGTLRGREWVCGRLTVADFALANYLATRAEAGVDLAPYPYVAAWIDRVEARESWRLAVPPR